MSHPSCIIRAARKSEIKEIEEGAVEAYMQYRSQVPVEIFEAYRQDLRNLSRYWDEAEVLVADVDGRIAGSVQFYPDASTEGFGLPPQWAGFRKLAVHPAARGRSIGRTLVEKCLELAARNGAPAIAIHTSLFMEAARHIYEDMGFQRCPEYDLRATDMLGIDGGSSEVIGIAYRRDIEGAHPGH